MVGIDAQYPIDDFESQSRALLRNLSYQQSLYLAIRCSELGIGTYHTRNEVEALLLCWIPDGIHDLDRFVYTTALSRLQKKLECIESDVGLVSGCRSDENGEEKREKRGSEKR